MSRNIKLKSLQLFIFDQNRSAFPSLGLKEIYFSQKHFLIKTWLFSQNSPFWPTCDHGSHSVPLHCHPRHLFPHTYILNPALFNTLPQWIFHKANDPWYTCYGKITHNNEIRASPYSNLTSNSPVNTQDSFWRKKKHKIHYKWS